MNLNKRPFIAVGGCPRSGTTALVNLLNIDGRLFITREFRVFKCWQVPIGHNLLQYKYKREKYATDIFKRHKLDIHHLLKYTKGCTGKNLANFVTKKLPDLKYFGDKLPRFHLYNTRQLAKQFPKMKFIFCLRDGRAVIASQIRLFKTKKTNANFVASNIENAEHLWIKSCEALERNLLCQRLEGRIHIVRYEEAVRNPKKTVREIGKFLGVKNLSIKDHKYKPIHLDAWKTEHPEMDNKLSKKFKKYLERFEYV